MWIFRKVLAKTMRLPRDNFGEQKVLKSKFFRLSKSLKSKILATMVPLPDILGLLQIYRFKLLGAWNVCTTFKLAQLISI